MQPTVEICAFLRYGDKPVKGYHLRQESPLSLNQTAPEQSGPLISSLVLILVGFLLLLVALFFDFWR